MSALSHPLRSYFLGGLGPWNVFPVARKISHLDLEMWRCVGYVRPPIFKVQSSDICSRRIEVNEELQQTERYRG